MTPLMNQYSEMKKKHPDAILLFRIGDFYETFKQDAEDCSQILGITLTRRHSSEGSMKLTGFPHHALDTYLPRLVRAGRRVAICEQLEDPKLTKKLVKRGITETITPNKVQTCDFSHLISFLSAVNEFLNKIYILDQIKANTAKLRDLALSVGISPKLAFTAFNEPDYQPTLFD